MKKKEGSPIKIFIQTFAGLSVWVLTMYGLAWLAYQGVSKHPKVFVLGSVLGIVIVSAARASIYIKSGGKKSDASSDTDY